MKRSPAIIPLSHDHHHALAQAARLRRAATADPAERLDAARAFARFFDEAIVPHFREEEELLFPLAVPLSAGARGLLEQVLIEHVEIHALVGQLRRDLAAGLADAVLLRDASRRLEVHIRREERDLFPLIEREVPAPLLYGLTLAPRSREAQNRSHEARETPSPREQDAEEEGSEGGQYGKRPPEGTPPR